MTPFLLATLVALAGVGALALVWRRGDRRRFRRALAATGMAGVLIVLYAMFVAGGEQQRLDASEVVLEDVRLLTVAGSYRVEGTVRNRSTTHALSSLPLRLEVLDCASGQDCRTAWRGEAEAVMTVQPASTAAFRQVFVPPEPPPPAERLRWRLEPGAPRAWMPSPH